MIKFDPIECIDSLLHCVHADNLIGPSNALLQYCALRVLRDFADSETSPANFNHICWTLRERLAEPAIRFLKMDPINNPPRSISGIRSILLLPNNSSLDSRSTLVEQARIRYPADIEAEETTQGAVVRSVPKPNDYYSEVWHLVCRIPSDPALESFSECLISLLSAQHVTMFRIPVFGRESEAGRWAAGLARWLVQRENIQYAPAFLDLCYTEESSNKARRIAAELDSFGLPHSWPEGA